MRFSKLHGLGNDYIFLDCMEGLPEDLPRLARRLSDRHFGVGGDGIICVCPSDRADFMMRMFNADGSEGAMCGNGIRCFGKYVYDRGLTDKARLTIETGAGLRTLELIVEDAQAVGAAVDMGVPMVDPPVTLTLAGAVHTAVPVSMGNPHAVIEAADLAALDLAVLGPLAERHPAFPGRVNAEFIRVLDRQTVEMRVWERGSGETLACGTGACAVAVAAVLNGKSENDATVQLLGGDLSICWKGGSEPVYMTGPAVTVFDGEVMLPEDIK